MSPSRPDATRPGAMMAAGAHPGAVGVCVQGFRRGAAHAGADWVAEEWPVALEFNGIAHAVMLATPLDLDDFALGFALCEGIVEQPAQVYDIECRHGAQGVTVAIEIASEAFARLKERRRSIAGRTGCGICGTENLQQVLRPLPPLPPLPPAGGAEARIARPAIARALADAAQHQRLQRLTGAVHAATWCAADGTVMLQREDVGRHNALDKLVGARARQGATSAPPAAGWIAVTSRASLEMVQKAVIAGSPLLVAVSAPTSMAIDVARQSGLALCGFARGDDLVAYTHPERIAW